MKRQKHVHERGDALVIVLILIIIALVAGGGWWAWKQHHDAVKKPAASSSTTQTTKPATQQKTASTGQQPCDATTLSLAEGTSDGTAGTIYKHAVVKNTGSVACTITGYPTATLVDNSGVTLGSAAVPNPLYSSTTTIVLSPGQQAHAVLGFPDAGAYDNSSACSAASARLHLVLHGTTTTLSTAWVDQSCPDFSVTAFQLGA